MAKLRFLLAILVLVVLGAAVAQPIRVGVSWANFQEERWKVDEAAIVARLHELGAVYLSTDARASVEAQLTDIESLIARDVDVLIVLAQDTDAVLPAVAAATARGIPVIGYDRLLEAEGVFYMTFDNVEVGRMQARAIFEAQPTGNYVFIMGSPLDPNAFFLRDGQQEVLQAAIDRGDITIVGEHFTDGWLPEIAMRNMEGVLVATSNQVDAVVASNDGTAGGVVAALAAQGLAGLVPVSGQDADHAALNRIALGTQTVSVWKDVRVLGAKAAEVAVLLAQGTALDAVPGATIFTGGPRAIPMHSILLAPIAITRDNLDIIIDAGWVSREVVCHGVDPASATAPEVCK